MTVPSDTPPLDELADEHDQDGWDREKHGSFADYAAPDDAVPCVPADEYLAGEVPEEYEPDEYITRGEN